MNFVAQCVRALIRVRAWVREIDNAVREQSPSRHQAEEIKGRKDLPRYEVNAVLSFDNETIRTAKTESTEQQKTQNSIKKATWGAVIAASIYALISLCIWYEMRQTTSA